MVVETAATGAAAIEIAERSRLDIALLDLVLPDMSGLEVMEQLRARSEIPIILLTAHDHDRQRIEGLDRGADDYLGKPFNPGELVARIRAVMRRMLRSATGESVLHAGHLEIDLEQRRVLRDGEFIELTRTEWALLQQLAMNPGKVMLNSELLSNIWGPEHVDELHYVRSWVSRLRGKLEDDPSNPALIKTVQGLGYTLDIES